MAKTSKKKQSQNTSDTSSLSDDVIKKPTAAKVKKRTRKSVPRDLPLKRSSIYRGVTRHRWTGRYEAHLWDKNCWNESQNKKGRQVYLGAYDDEEAAAHAYDLAALKYWGPDTILNFPLSTYQEEIKEMDGQSREEYIGSLRRKSSGFSRGVSKYRGVARHHHNGRWEARIGRVFGNKYLYLGTYATQEEAAMAYDMAAIEYRGLNAVTNFDLSRYIKWLRPNQDTTNPNPNPNSSSMINTNKGDINNTLPESMPEIGLSTFLSEEVAVAPPSRLSASTGGSASSALGLLLQSSKFTEMLERTCIEDDCPLTPPESDLPRRSFPDDIQTYFHCQDGSSSFAEGDDSIFADLNSFASPIFNCELDNDHN